jgi:hypothetical protein
VKEIIIIMRVNNALLSCALAVLFLVPLASAASVTRSFSPAVVPPGGQVTVNLNVNVTGAADYYVIDEIFPSGWTMIDPGEGITQHSGHWKFVVIEGAENKIFSYVLQAPETKGSAAFSGKYMFGGMEDSIDIEGPTNIVIETEAIDMNLVVGILIVIVVAVFLYLVTQNKFPKKK